jgi:hypothetical protein
MEALSQYHEAATSPPRKQPKVSMAEEAEWFGRFTEVYNRLLLLKVLPWPIFNVM